MAGRLCGLGFSGSTLAAAFDMLRAVGETRPVLVIENMRTEDKVPYDCGVAHRRIWHEEYSWDADDMFFFAVTTPLVKAAVYEFFASRFPLPREKFVNLIHPSVQIAYQHQLATGIRLDPGCVIAPFAELGFGVGLMRGASVGHHAQIEDFASMSTGARTGGHSRVGRRSFIGMGAMVFDHTAVGEDCLVGGGSVVNKDIPDGVVAYGNPCRVVRKNAVE